MVYFVSKQLRHDLLLLLKTVVKIVKHENTELQVGVIGNEE